MHAPFHAAARQRHASHRCALFRFLGCGTVSPVRTAAVCRSLRGLLFDHSRATLYFPQFVNWHRKARPRSSGTRFARRRAPIPSRPLCPNPKTLHP